MRFPTILATAFFAIYGYLALATSYTGQPFDFAWYVAGIMFLPWKLWHGY